MYFNFSMSLFEACSGCSQPFTLHCHPSSSNTTLRCINMNWPNLTAFLSFGRLSSQALFLNAKFFTCFRFCAIVIGLEIYDFYLSLSFAQKSLQFSFSHSPIIHFDSFKSFIDVCCNEREKNRRSIATTMPIIKQTNFIEQTDSIGAFLHFKWLGISWQAISNRRQQSTAR